VHEAEAHGSMIRQLLLTAEKADTVEPVLQTVTTDGYVPK